MSAPTLGEEQLLIDFRVRVRDVLDKKDYQQTSFLIRWIRARDLDLKQAESLLRTSLEWRKEKGIDQILELPVDAYCQREFPYYMTGVDKKGQPVFAVPIGKWDFRKCVHQGKTDEFKHYVTHGLETVCNAIQNANKTRDPSLYPITQFTTILDFTGYSYMQLSCLKAIQNMLYGARMYEAHYPEVLYKCIFVNFSSILNFFLMMLKQVVAAKTFAKLSIYGSNREEWELACREIIDDDQLEEILKLFS